MHPVERISIPRGKKKSPVGFKIIGGRYNRDKEDEECNHKIYKIIQDGREN